MKPQIRTRSRWIALAISLASATPLLAAPPAQFNSSLTSGATTVAVNYALHPIRGANFQVLMQDSAGIAHDNFAAIPGVSRKLFC